MTSQAACPCGSGPYATCCEPLHQGRSEAATAEALMRSRFSAFALGLSDYLWRTWHPRTRPEQVRLDDTRWTRLDIVDAVDGTERDSNGVVEFVARYQRGRRQGRLHERSRFERRGRRWLYLDGEQFP